MMARSLILAKPGGTIRSRGWQQRGVGGDGRDSPAMTLVSEQRHLGFRSLGPAVIGDSELAAVEALAGFVETPLAGGTREAAQQQVGIDTLAGEAMVEAGVAEAAGTGFADQAEDVLRAIGEVGG